MITQEILILFAIGTGCGIGAVLILFISISRYEKKIARLEKRVWELGGDY